jgi:hypothetical protein
MVCDCPIKGSCKKYGKGMKSKTMKGKLDYTTKKGSKTYNRGGKRQTTRQGKKKKSLPFVM